MKTIAKNKNNGRRRVASFALLGLSTSLFVQAQATAAEADEIEALRAEIHEIRQESQREIERLREQSDRKIRELLLRIEALQASLEAAAPADNEKRVDTRLAAPVATHSDRLDISGDFRLRFEDNSSLGTSAAYSRGVLRGRLAASFRVANEFTLGARLVTGNPDDPRTADATIGDFARDLNVSFDQMYAEYRFGNLMLVGGKFPNPFVSSELVWDGDVNPQGLSGRYTILANDLLSAQLTGMYFAIDEETSPTKSDMLGGQISLTWHAQPNWKLSFALGHYDYDIPAIEAGLPGGPRGNNVAADGVTYLSDFNLLDSIATVDYLGFGKRWPLQIVANHVINRGATVSEDSAFNIDLFAGHLNNPGAFKLRYGYSQAEADAVLGVFSQDNISFGTNYELHTLSVDYALLDRTYLGLTHYRFRQKDAISSTILNTDWADRTRLNLYFSF